MKNYLFTFLFFFSSAFQLVFAEDEKQKIRGEIKSWYESIGFPQDIPLSVFEHTVNKHAEYRKKGTIPNKNIMGIINYGKDSAKKRLYIFTIGSNPKMVHTEYVAHGKYSGGSIATSFSNVAETKKSSKGFWKGGYIRKGGGDFKFPKAMIMHGLEPGINDNIEARTIIMHKANYIGDGKRGRSWGCPAIPASRVGSVKKLLANGTLVYGYDGKSTGGSGELNYEALKDKASESDHDSVPEQDEDYKGEPIDDPSFSPYTAPPEQYDANVQGPSGDSVGPNGELSSEIAENNEEAQEEEKDDDNKSMSYKTQAPESITTCQMKVQQCGSTWEAFVSSVNRGASASSVSRYFACQNPYAYQNTKGQDNAHDYSHVSRAKLNLKIAQDCTALAASMGNTNFKESTTPRKVCSEGKTFCCNISYAAQDAKKCEEGVKEAERFEQKEAALKLTQKKNVIELSGTTLTAVKQTAVQNGVQSSAPTAQAEFSGSMAKNAFARSQLQIEKRDRLNEIRKQMPTRNTILSECRQKMAKYSEVGKKEYNTFVSYFDGFDKAPISNPDPCLNVAKKMKTNLIQNIDGKKQLERLIDVTDLKSKDLTKKGDTLNTRANAVKGISFKGTNSDFGFGTNAGRSQAELAKLKRLRKSGSGAALCEDGVCINQTYGNVTKKMRLKNRGNGLGDFGKSQKSRAQSNSYSNSYLQRKRGGNNKGQKNNVFNYKKGQVHSKSSGKAIFWNQNIDNALAGKYPLKKLSAKERAAYNEHLRLAQNRNPAQSEWEDKQILDAKLKRLQHREIWFNSDLDLFHIIHLRYQKKFFQKEEI